MELVDRISQPVYSFDRRFLFPFDVIEKFYRKNHICQTSKIHLAKIVQSIHGDITIPRIKSISKRRSQDAPVIFTRSLPRLGVQMRIESRQVAELRYVVSPDLRSKGSLCPHSSFFPPILKGHSMVNFLNSICRHHSEPSRQAIEVLDMPNRTYFTLLVEEIEQDGLIS